MKSLLIGTVAALALVASAGALEAADYKSREGSLQIGTGLGFIASLDEGFSLLFDAHYNMTEHFSAGPRLTLAFPSDAVLFTAVMEGRFNFDLPEQGVERLKPYVSAGLGFAVIDVDGFYGSEAAFLLEFGGGANYYLTDQFSLGTDIQFLIPVELLNDNFIFQWEVLQARYLF